MLLLASLIPSMLDQGARDGQPYYLVAVVVFGTTIVAVPIVYVSLTRSARRAGRALRVGSSATYVALGDNSFLGSIALLRPNIPAPMKLGRFVAVSATDSMLKIWGGRGGQTKILEAPWSFVTSIEVEEGDIFGATFPCLRFRLAGAHQFPLTVMVRKPGVGVWLGEGVGRSDEIANQFNEIRQAAAEKHLPSS